jgi:hypothetical protein
VGTQGSPASGMSWFTEIPIGREEAEQENEDNTGTGSLTERRSEKEGNSAKDRDEALYQIPPC